jgi:hypothetical protein
VTRLLWIGKERTIESVQGFFTTMGEEITSKIVFMCRTPLVKESHWLLLKREESLKAEQRFRLRDLLRYNLKTVRAYLLKEAFQQLWDYSSPSWAGKFLDEWCRQTMRSRIEPMKKIARSLRQHRELILVLELSYFTRLASCLSRNAPTISSDEPLYSLIGLRHRPVNWGGRFSINARTPSL